MKTNIPKYKAKVTKKYGYYYLEVFGVGYFGSYTTLQEVERVYQLLDVMFEKEVYIPDLSRLVFDDIWQLVHRDGVNLVFHKEEKEIE